MPVLDPVFRKDREMLDQNRVSDAVLNMYDIREALSSKVKNKSLHEPTTDYTIGDCIDDVILFLESLEERIEK
jgi:hypothetical protein